MPQYPLQQWFHATPYPASGPMSRPERDLWLRLVMMGSHLLAMPKEGEMPEPPNYRLLIRDRREKSA
jgi:hypothetical protein